MDLLRLFTFRITFHSFVGVGIIIIILFAVLAGKTLCLDPQFVACEPRTCGVGPSISYPFWIANKQESYCGYPGFEIACEDRHPVLRIADDGFTIRNIYHGNHSFLVANSAFYDEECPSPLHNFTLRRTPFSYSTFHAELFFFFNCTKTPVDYPTIPVNCASNASHSTFAVFHEDLLVRKYYSANTCTASASAPVDVHGSVFRSSSTMNATKLLKEGFLLDWAAPNCSDCERSGGRCGFGNNTFLCFCRDGPSDKTCINGHGRDWVLKTVIGVVAAILGMGMMCLFFFLYQRRRNKRYVISSLLSRNISSGPSMKMDSEKGGHYMGVHIFTYAELEEATNNFDSAKELGDGGFGTVYQGKLQDGRSVAVKRLYENNYRRLEQFMNEVEILTRLRHHNLVSLYGCTSRHSRELLLVYEYIPNGTVADHLHGDRAKSGPLTWPIRMSIALETASALSYLHASDIIHRDVKTNNILLDSNFCVKVADFGLSRLFPNDVTHISTAPQGTPGYVDPEYHQCYQLTDKSDVYSFGVVLMELISSKPAVDITRHRHEINLSNMAITKIQNHTLHELVDPCLGYETEYKARKMIGAVAELAFQCLQNEKEMRPSMEEVLETLNHIQSDGSNVEKAGEREGDVPGDDAVLLKSKALTLSPDTVTVNWTSRATTPNASN